MSSALCLTISAIANESWHCILTTLNVLKVSRMFTKELLQEGDQNRFSVAELLPVLQSLLENLFAAFSITDSAENEYVMKCVMRVISFVGPQVRTRAFGHSHLKHDVSASCQSSSKPFSCSTNCFQANYMLGVCLQIAPVAPQCLEQLSKLLLTVCKNPTVPGFNHYLFESVAALIKNSATAQPESVATLESMLFPPFQIVLSEDVQVWHLIALDN